MAHIQTSSLFLNLGPSNFALFPALKVTLVGKKFSNDEVKTLHKIISKIWARSSTNRADKN